MDGAALAAHCAQAGWPASQRPTGEVGLRIEARHASYGASLSMTWGGGLRAVVPLDASAWFTPVRRAATARLLLVLSGTMRLVKGVMTEDAAGVSPALAAACPPPRTTSDVARVLSALTVACDVAGREVRALADDRLARAYLALGPAPPVVTPDHLPVESPFDVPADSHPKEDLCLQQR